MARESIEERRARLTPGALWIRAQREKRGLTGRELARRLDIAQDRISAYERAQDEPSLDFARGLADLFGMTEFEVWRGLHRPLPRGLDVSAMTKDEAIAYVRDMYPGELERLTGHELASGDAPSADSPNSVAPTGESGRSASL